MVFGNVVFQGDRQIHDTRYLVEFVFQLGSQLLEQGQVIALEVHIKRFLGAADLADLLNGKRQSGHLLQTLPHLTL